MMNFYPDGDDGGGADSLKQKQLVEQTRSSKMAILRHGPDGYRPVIQAAQCEGVLVL
jgi:hypothetical protein